jgi:hypothetical protein
MRKVSISVGWSNRWHAGIVAALLVWCLVLCWTGVAATDRRDANARVLMHYMPWFKAEAAGDGRSVWDHWQWFGKGRKHDPDDVLPNGRRDIASVYYPLIGPYDSRNPAVIEYHLLTAKAAGIEGLVADWYGPEDYTDVVFAEVVKAAERYGLSVALCLEEKTFFPGYATVQSRAEVMDVMARQVRYVLDHYAVSPAYLRRDGRPVFFIFNGHEKGSLGNHWLSPEEVEQVQQGLGDDAPMLVRGQADPAFAGVVKAGYGWCGNAAYRESFYRGGRALKDEGRLTCLVGPVCPGFDDSGVNGWGRGARIDDRRGTREYEEYWEDVLRHQPDAVQIVTWNDFQEGTSIEPAEEYGFTFVDLTEQFVEQYTGRRARMDDNRWPHRLYRLRQRLSQVEDAEERTAWSGALDEFSRDMAQGRRWLMGWRLSRLEKGLGVTEPG